VKNFTQNLKHRIHSRQLKDDISKRLANEKINPLDLETESSIIDILVENNKPNKWAKFDFNPAENLADCVELVETAFPQEIWSVDREIDGFYVAYVANDSYSVVSFSSSRALIWAAWNAYRISNDSGTE